MTIGLTLENKKRMSISNEIVDFSDPSKVYIPLINNNVLCKSLVKKGKKVKKGTIIGIRQDIDFPILSSVSGIVLDEDSCLYLNNKMVPCIVIKNDKKDSVVKKEIKKDISDYTKDEYIEVLKDCAVTGMGGSDFPAFIKYKGDLDILIVNAVECEPYLTSDLMLTKLKAEIILDTIEAIMKINNISKCFIAYKEDNKTIYYSLLRLIKNYDNIFITPVKNIYPIGWERYLVSNILKLEYNKYPNEIGVVVNNISTIFAIYKALKFKRSITKRIITISGEGFSNPINVLVKVGTKMDYVLNKLGDYTYNDNLNIIAGGPMMGVALKDDSVVATNNLNGLIVLPKEDDTIVDCIKCGKCIKVCPSNILPVFIMNTLDNKSKLKKFNPELCCECGLCSYVCPSKINVREYVKHAIKEVK